MTSRVAALPYQSTIRAPQVVDFLAHLLRHLPGRLLVICSPKLTFY
jgi:hypothetical protein